MHPTNTTTPKPVTRAAPDEAPIAGRGRVKVAEVWFKSPLPKLAQGAAYIGSGDGWSQFSVMADLDARLIIATVPGKRTFRIPFENTICYITG